MPTTDHAGQRCTVIAEAGVNHDGELAVAHRLVDLAADVGADVVKFQTFSADAVVAAGAPLATYQERTGAPDQHSMVAALELPSTAWAELAAHARERDIGFVSTPFDAASADLLEEIGVERFKVPSGELTNLGFLRDLASRGKPLIVSTGMATIDEVDVAVEAALAAPELVLMHCVSAYPAPLEEANLRAIPAMSDRYHLRVGWSDHTDGSIAALGAVALGATVLEKHLTLDRALPGPDHAASADPEEFARYVAAVRALEAALGDGDKRPQPSEADVRRVARRSWHATRDLPVGTRLGPDDVVALRPADGISPSVTVVGARLTRAITAGEALEAGHVDLARGEPARG